MSRYQYTKTFSYNGKRYYCYGNTREEAERKCRERKKKLEREERSLHNITVSEWAKIAVRTYKTNQSEETYKRYVSRLRKCILSHIGNRRMKSLKPVDLQNVLNRQIGRSKTQINEVYYQLKFLCKTAKQNGIIPTDPAEDLIRPQAHKKEPRRALTDAERAYIKILSLRDRRFYVFALMLLCGCRPEEACECKGSDIKRHTLHIRGTKTALSDRFVPIPDKLYEIIKNTPESEYIGVTEQGHRIERRKRSKLWKQLLDQLEKAMGSRPDIVPYCLRHEYCTQLARMGIDIRIAQKLMGHADVNMTANIYTNLSRHDVDLDELKDL